MSTPPTTSELVRCEVRNAVATITLNRPESLNALNREMRDALAALLAWCADQTDAVRAVVLAGAGRAFCAGQDLREEEGPLSAASSVEGKRRGDFQALLAEQPQPTIAALHGYVIGRGLEVALTCDLRIAADDAQLGLPEVNLGMIPASGGTQRLPRLIGEARALHLVLTAERIDAATALDWGLVTRVVPGAELAAAAQALGERLASHAPLALRYARRAIQEGGALSLADGLHLEAALAGVLRTTQDRAEGPRAFRERRPPRFIGA
ncbi:MAG TPA: enoyl-CoA hydratase-related protein [Chloroflexota bacterium]|nr:enoyl-CoA hydratase-related protein [Chloroflexota bacterium]